MKYTLEVQFETDDLDPEESELVEDIRHEVEDVIHVHKGISNIRIFALYVPLPCHA